jgi:hypothetical protein
MVFAKADEVKAFPFSSKSMTVSSFLTFERIFFASSFLICSGILFFQVFT